MENATKEVRRSEGEKGVFANIRASSPMLESTLRRWELSEPWQHSLDQVFAFALANGGAAELDFERAEGASYNPRPARIAHILIFDCEVKDPELIAEAILGTVPGGKRPSGLPVRVRRLLSLEDATLLAAVHFLDRARHFHIAEKQGVAIAWRERFKEGEDFAVLLRERAPRLAFVLASWCERVRSKLERGGDE